MKTGLLIAGGVLGVGLIGYGIWYFSGQYELIKKTCFNFVGYEAIALNRDHIKIKIQLRVKNLSNITVQIKGYEFDVKIGGKPITKVFSATAATLPANGSTVLDIMIDVNPKKLFDLNFYSNLLINYQTMVVDIKGSVSARAETGFLSIGANRVPVSIQSTLRDMIPAPGAPETADPCKN